MSFDTDAIIAFQGMFGHLGVRHCWGMPFEYPESEMSWSGAFETSQPQNEVTLSLAWRSLSPRKRRPGFPIWSWASVEGTTVFDSCTVQPSEYKVEVAIAEDAWITAGQYFNSFATSEDFELSPLLRVITYVTRPQLVSAKWVRKNTPAGVKHRSKEFFDEKLFAIMKFVGVPDFLIYEVCSDIGTLTADDLPNAVAMFIGRRADDGYCSHLILLPSGCRFRRVAFAFPSRHLCFSFTPADVHWWVRGQEFLKRTDDDFIFKTTKRALVLE
jgi:hypothetical protein